jgi:hypothetical protein
MFGSASDRDLDGNIRLLDGVVPIMRARSIQAVFYLVLVIGVNAGRSQTNTQSKTAAPSILNFPPDADPRYFPKGIFGDSSDSGSFKDFAARWYSAYLRAMHEPSLFEASNDRSLVAYRFLWLRTFHHPIAIRLTIRPNGTGTLIGKITSGAGGYKTGVMTWDKSVEISTAQVQQFLIASQKAAFWTLPTGGLARGNDGAQWIMEGVHAGVYHVVDRWSPEKTDYANMCLFLLGVSTIQIDAKDVY